MNKEKDSKELETLERRSWENPINFDRLQIAITIFTIGYIHSNNELSKSCILKILLLLLAISFILSIVGYLLTQKELDDKIKKIRNSKTEENKRYALPTLWHNVNTYIWWFSGICFTIAISGILIFIILS